ncbi:hypothetical protein Y1Q_0019232 [Alligator mississippiensis]|uniref:Secreted protein n=1 Tax=Alligator mississippiensis TaxID=8496 RepID=A0A151MQI7_ALLMI|nr:hypothetical protein Y1Q_0019232 [Alligator mississippiensis]
MWLCPLLAWLTGSKFALGQCLHVRYSAVATAWLIYYVYLQLKAQNSSSVYFLFLISCCYSIQAPILEPERTDFRTQAETK